MIKKWWNKKVDSFIDKIVSRLMHKCIDRFLAYQGVDFWEALRLRMKDNPDQLSFVSIWTKLMDDRLSEMNKCDTCGEDFKEFINEPKNFGFHCQNCMKKINKKLSEEYLKEKNKPSTANKWKEERRRMGILYKDKKD